MKSVRLCLPGLVLASLGVGCRSDGSLQGTLVGNPGDASLAPAPTSGTTFRTARLPVDALAWLPCGGGPPEVVAIGRTVDLLARERLEAPEGFWCGLEVSTEGALELQVDAAGGGAAQLQLEVGVVAVASRGFASGAADPLVLELGRPEWLDPTVLGFAGAGDEVRVEAGTPEHDALANTAAASSGLFADDGDRVVDDAERAAGEVAAGPDRGVEDDDDDDEDEDDDTGE